MAQWGLKYDAKEAAQRLEYLLRGLKNRRELHERYVIVAQVWVFRNWPKSPGLSGLTLGARQRGGSAVLLDSGKLRQSFTGQQPSAKVASGPDTLNVARDEHGVLGTRIPWAGVHHRGAFIHPKRAKYLAIPTTPESTKAGSPRNFPRKLFFIPFKGQSRRSSRGGWLAESGSQGITRRYLLKLGVKLPERKLIPTPEDIQAELVLVTEMFLDELTTGRLN